jgi:hypothetical protein
VPLSVVYTPTLRPPVFKDARYDPATRVLYLKVLPGGDLAGDVVDWVKVFQDTPGPGGTVNTVQYGAALGVVANQFEDPFGYTVTLPVSPPLAQLRVVAYTKGYKYRSVPITSLVGVYTSHIGGALNAQFDFTGTDWWYIGMVDVERVPPPALYYAYEYTPWVGPGAVLWNWKAQVSPNGNPDLWVPAYGLADLYLRDSSWECSRFYLGFARAAVRVAPGGRVVPGVRQGRHRGDGHVRRRPRRRGPGGGLRLQPGRRLPLQDERQAVREAHRPVQERRHGLVDQLVRGEHHLRPRRL